MLTPCPAPRTHPWIAGDEVTPEKQKKKEKKEKSAKKDKSAKKEKKKAREADSGSD